MALSYLKKTQSLEEYIETRIKQDPSTGAATRAAYTNANLFCQDQFKREFITVLADMAQEVKNSNELDTPLNFMQRFINWLSEPHLELKMNPSSVYPDGAPCKAKETGTIRGMNGQLRLIMKKVGGIPISKDDVTDFKLSYPPPAPREKKRKMTNEEFMLICDAQTNFKRKTMYKIKKDAESRIGAMVQLVKEDFDTTKVASGGYIEITFPASIMKKKNGVSYENVKYVIKEDEEAILKLLDQTPAGGLVFGVTKNLKLAVNDEEKVWSRLVTNLGLGQRYKHNGFLQLSLHTIKSLTFTAARKAVDLDFANAYGDHADYIRNYLRLSDEEKIEYFKRLEPHITMWTRTEIVHDSEEVLQENILLKKQISAQDQKFDKMCEEIKSQTNQIPDEKLQEMFEKFIKKNKITV